jgi:hypothetical protein
MWIDKVKCVKLVHLSEIKLFSFKKFHLDLFAFLLTVSI